MKIAGTMKKQEKGGGQEEGEGKLQTEVGSPDILKHGRQEETGKGRETFIAGCSSSPPHPRGATEVLATPEIER